MAKNQGEFSLTTSYYLLQDAIDQENLKFGDEDEDEGPVRKVAVRVVDEQLFQKNEAKMNSKQREIYDIILGSIEDQVLAVTNDTKKMTAPEPFFRFVSGTAGTGKSFLINLLADKLTLKYGSRTTSDIHPTVLLAAPTGLAALNINGNTLHSLFRIEVICIT